ncbi:MULTISPECIES: proteasome assembly chaperone family protein [unclassified Halorubrum]|uniref:proteasome assembly chaperone family protein n=1 Tax=unclassified Halorubrum TaxID=2642239 RepID=UPI000B982B87|nr:MULTISPECIES: proteasome assembly chaperone family protein [unclassified Halorubrum]OYR44689.1 proteasome assembly chaperone family protein [Halorubrum sp. Hd13]OYR46543.1 proteasome assembly chaperone family protein [Halorubrum sp. Ea8]OYR55134.1 proteasome assembly chaperone family protein [Halorubrum sp. Ea1]
MDDIEIDEVATPELDDPVLIEGLPGVGHVGKLAAEHLLEEFDGELVRRVYTTEFPPQVSVDGDGVAELTCAEFHAVETDGADLLVLTGDHQAGSNAGHYTLTTTFLDIAEEFGATRAYALGGVPTGELVEEYTVLGAVSDADLVEGLKDAGVEFRPDEPAGGIVGVSGLVLGLGGRRGFDAACLMGETSGYLVDPKSARAVLETLEAVLDFSVDYESLEDRAEEMEEVVGKIREMQDGPAVPDDDLRYIG